jgi:hypothetical protein
MCAGRASDRRVFGATAEQGWLRTWAFSHPPPELSGNDSLRVIGTNVLIVPEKAEIRDVMVVEALAIVPKVMSGNESAFQRPVFGCCCF